MRSSFAHPLLECGKLIFGPDIGDAFFQDLKSLVYVGGGIASEHALPGKQFGELVEPRIGVGTKLAEFPMEFPKLLAKLAEKTKGVIFRVGHG